MCVMLGEEIEKIEKPAVYPITFAEKTFIDIGYCYLVKDVHENCVLLVTNKIAVR